MQQMNDDQLTEPRLSRTRFIRQLGITVAAGIGAIALPAVAGAGRMQPDFQYQCCPRSDLCGYCPGGKPGFWCTCPGGNYCTCNFTGSGCTNCIS